MIENVFGTQHVAMATKKLCLRLLLMLNHKMSELHVI